VWTSKESIALQRQSESGGDYDDDQQNHCLIKRRQASDQWPGQSPIESSIDAKAPSLPLTSSGFDLSAPSNRTTFDELVSESD
jgi:hypothetical protein